MAKGYLIVNVYADDIYNPVENARIVIRGRNFEKTVRTDESGKSEVVELEAPEKEYSLMPQDQIVPYSTYDIRVTKDGLQSVIVSGVEILPGEVSYQNVFMSAIDDAHMHDQVIELPEHALVGDYDPKIPESFIKDAEDIESMNLRVLPRVILPEYIIVHNGIPTNTTASNYTVLFTDYIKNVASSEIYSTWPRETIKANVYAIISFTMNRIFTEWYRSNGLCQLVL